MTQQATDQGAPPPGASPAGPGDPPALGPGQLARWGWRQLTSMRTALVLLFLLALAAVPGSVVPQRDVDAIAVARWENAHPRLAPLYERLGLFDVYSSIWFSAIYLLLVVSLVGCIVPRTRVYWRGMRARPPKAPRRLDRMPQSRSFETDSPPEAVLTRAGAVLGRRRYRVDVHADPTGAPGAVAAERGYLREAGNLLFHVSVLVALVGVAYGGLFGYKGGVIVVSGQGFSNSLSQYDDFAPGALFDPEGLSPFSLTLDRFDIEYQRRGEQAGSPLDFTAHLSYSEAPGRPERRYDLKVNHPLQVDGANVFLVGNGYAPHLTVRDGEGDVAASGPVVFLPEDATFKSFGVLKAPDARPEQLALEGYFAPTYGFSMERGLFSQFPDALDPRLSLLAYHGDLGLDDGEPQSVYALDKEGLELFETGDGRDFRLDLSLGETVALPGGAGTVTYDGVERWVKLQISDSPGKGIALAGVVLAIVGLLGSLFVRPRRVWVRATRGEGRTLVELAGLDRSAGGHLAGELDEIERLVGRPPGGWHPDDETEDRPEERPEDRPEDRPDSRGAESRENA